jgi:2-polyprenyl-6-methoxyphenol hydroxylase-like FAD-dependent oxidoreductase
VGADGLHSVTRRLAFVPERDYLRHLGLYVALTDLPTEARADRTSPLYNYPGHLASIARYKNKAYGVVLFRSGLLDSDYRDLDAQKKILLDAFAGHTEWKIPQLLDAVRADPEFYFDSVSQIHMPTWYRGRIALVGAAAHCAALLSGRGTSLALGGAHFLAEELEDTGGDHTVAFERYEQRQRPYAEFAQNSVTDGGELIVPSTQEAIDARTRGSRPSPPDGGTGPRPQPSAGHATAPPCTAPVAGHAASRSWSSATSATSPPQTWGRSPGP